MDQQTLLLISLIVLIIVVGSPENPLSSLADSFSRSSYVPLSESSYDGSTYNNGEPITGDFKIGKVKIKKPGFIKQVQEEIGRVDNNAKEVAQVAQAEAARVAERAKAEAMREIKDAGKVGQSSIDELKKEVGQAGAEAQRVGDRVGAEVKREAEDVGKVGENIGKEYVREIKDADKILTGGLGEKAVAESERLGNKVGKELARTDENLKKRADDLKKFYDPSALKEMFCK